MSLKKGTTALRDFTFTPSTQSLDRERLQVTKTVQKHKQLVPPPQTPLYHHDFRQ